MPIPTIHILGTPIAVTDYPHAIAKALALAKESRPAAISACNTHLVTLARQNPHFRKVLRDFDLNLPDGAPLLWNLNSRGAKLTDRVYGPYFMKRMIEQASQPWRHFLFGGSEACLKTLTHTLKNLNPELEIAGMISPPFREWSEEEEASFAQAIQESQADFIWVALGGGRQEQWIHKNLHRHSRGVFIAVGDAFTLLAGLRSFAPKWMQKLGLTWLHRLVMEPRRLLIRYFRFNSLYLYYLTLDYLTGKSPEALATSPSPRIAFMGSRGVPARYSGFEVVVEELGKRLVQRGYHVTVYNRLPHYQPKQHTYEGMRLIGLPTIPTKSLDTIVHTFLSTLHAIGQNYQIVYLCGVGNAILAGILRLLGCHVILNVDGADFRRAKWGIIGRTWLHLSEFWATRLAHFLIADNEETAKRYERAYQCKPVHLSYGCTIRTKPVSCGELTRWGLQPKGYILYVARLTPENAADLLIRAYLKVEGNIPLVICGSAYHEKRYLRRLQKLAGPRVLFTGPRYGDAYIELSQNAQFFVLPAAIEATRLVLLDQMAMGKAIIYRDCAATREVIGDAGLPFSSENPEVSLAEKMHLLSCDPSLQQTLGNAALERVKHHYVWEHVVDHYETLFEKALTTPRVL